MMKHNQKQLDFPSEFDFWQGGWSGEWLNIDENEEKIISKTVHKVFSVLDGKILIETAEETGEINEPAIISGFSMRYYNQKALKWVMIQSWPSKRGNFMGTLSGEFDRNRVEMKNSYVLENVEYKQKYTFSDITNNYFRWDRQVSIDDGKTWQLTMKLHFDRIMNFDNTFHKDYKLFSYYEGRLNEDKEITSKLFPKGKYTGKHGNNSAEIEIFDLIAGFGQLILIEVEETGEKLLIFVNWDSINQRWNLVKIDNKLNSVHSAYYTEGNQFIFKNNEKFNEISHGDEPAGRIKIGSNGSSINFDTFEATGNKKQFLEIHIN